jgi:hypothetical protein
MPIQLTTQSALRGVQNLAFCYLCAHPFESGEERNRDHVPPSTLFNSADRDTPLILPTHPRCNHGRSAEDELIGQLVGVLHGRVMVPQGRRPDIVRGSFPDGSLGLGATGVALKAIIWRWVCGFHAALYDQPVADSIYMVFPPMPEGRVVGDRVDAVPVPEVIPHLVQELRRNRTTGTLDSIVCRNGQCRYDCVWSQDDRGPRICIWALDLYGWKELGDVTHFEPRGCIGVYRPKNGQIPSTATLGTRLEFAVENAERLDPFGTEPYMDWTRRPVRAVVSSWRATQLQALTPVKPNAQSKSRR